jgi:hypothetical protein
MIGYSVKEVGMEDETLQITSDWMVERGSCLPHWLRFQVMGDNGPTLHHFHVNVNEETKGKRAQ